MRAGAAIILMGVVGCASIFDVDKDYKRDPGAGGASQTVGTAGTTTSGGAGGTSSQGQGGSAGMGGNVGMSCMSATDCGMPDECGTPDCINSMCGFGTVAPARTTCMTDMLCDGAGECVECLARSDCPSGAWVCEGNTCVNDNEQ